VSELSRRAPAFLALSLLAHALILLTMRGELEHDDDLLQLPDTIELGVTTSALHPGAEGEAGAPPPAAAAPVEKPRAPEPVPRPVLRKAEDREAIAIDAGVPDTLAPEDDGKAGVLDGVADGAPAFQSGEGQSPLGGGMGLGFGAGGFGSGRGGPPGAIIGLHADLGRIASTSLILETEPLLGLIPGWQDVLAGSGLDPIADFARVFVATPSLRRVGRDEPMQRLVEPAMRLVLRSDLEGEDREAHPAKPPPPDRFHEPLREYRAPITTPVPAATSTGMVPKFVGRGRVLAVVVGGEPDEYGVGRDFGVYEAATVVGGFTVAERGGREIHGWTRKNE
jgi:hypothetical protein